MNERKYELIELYGIMQNRNARAFFSRFLQLTGVFGDTFDRDALVQSYNAGKRKVGLLLIEELKAAAPELYNLMMQELSDGRYNRSTSNREDDSDD